MHAPFPWFGRKVVETIVDRLLEEVMERPDDCPRSPPTTLATEGAFAPSAPPEPPRRKRAPRVKLTAESGRISLDVDHANATTGWAMIMNAIGTDDLDFMRALLTQIASVGIRGSASDATGANFILSVVKSIEPRDELEAMLAAQMAAVHMATMTFASRLALVDTIPQQDSAERAFNKLARTFAVQMEALKRYRTGGEQKVTVQHVTVNEGGQAIVGAVSTPRAGGGG